MSESLTHRVKRLVSGAVNDGVDAMETVMAESVMKESIREIDQTISDVREEISKLQSERHIAGRRIALSREKIADLSKKIEQGLAANREDLAQAAVERQLDLEAQIPVLEKTQNEASERIVELSASVDALRGRKAEMAEELDAFTSARAEASSVDAVSSAMAKDRATERSVEKAEMAFSRVLKNATGVDTIGQSNRDTISKVAELERMERQEKIASRLDEYRKTG